MIIIKIHILKMRIVHTKEKYVDYLNKEEVFMECIIDVKLNMIPILYQVLLWIKVATQLRRQDI